MDKIVAIDPGKNYLGVACGDEKQLLGAGLIQRERNEGLQRYLRRAAAQVETLQPDRLVLESQFIDKRSRARAEDIQVLTYIAGAMSMCECVDVDNVSPSTWGARHDKEITLRRVKKRLSDDEWARIDLTGRKKDHNIIDAIGIYLWSVGRYKR